MYAVFLSFFLSLRSYPPRRKFLLPQIRNERIFDYATCTYGLKQMAWGFFKSLRLRTIGKYVTPVLRPSGLPRFFLPGCCRPGIFQIYCDFSGYTDIAIGIAVAGHQFDDQLCKLVFFPKHSGILEPVAYFPSTWFRDYLYIPLGGNRVPCVAQWL